MKNSAWKSFVSSLGLYFTFFLLVSVFAFWTTHHLFNQVLSLVSPSNVSYHDFLLLSASQVVTQLHPSDLATYAETAKYFLLHHAFEEWTINLWPPGQFFILAFLFRFFGEGSYPLMMILIVVAVWSLALVFVFRSLDHLNRPFLRFFITLLPFYFISLLYFIFGNGLFLSEALVMPLFVISICLFLRWLRTFRDINLITMSIILVIMAYIRGYFEIFGNFIIEAMVLVFVFLLVKNYFHNRKILSFWRWLKEIFSMRSPIFTQKKKTILVAVIVFMLLLLPWRIYLHYHRWQGSFAWQNGVNQWSLFWIPDQQNFWPTNNVACEIDRKICSVLYLNDIKEKSSWVIDEGFYKDLTLGMLILHPFDWYKIKLDAFNYFWFTDSHFDQHWSMLQVLLYDPWYFLSNLIILLLGIVAFILNCYLAYRCSQTQAKPLLFFTILFLLFNGVLFTFFHFEPRYSIFLKLYFVYYPFWLLFGLPEVNNCVKTWLNKKSNLIRG